jgi:hypothetical protein
MVVCGRMDASRVDGSLGGTAVWVGGWVGGWVGRFASICAAIGLTAPRKHTRVAAPPPPHPLIPCRRCGAACGGLEVDSPPGLSSRSVGVILTRPARSPSRSTAAAVCSSVSVGVMIVTSCLQQGGSRGRGRSGQGEREEGRCCCGRPTSCPSPFPSCPKSPQGAPLGQAPGYRHQVKRVRRSAHRDDGQDLVAGRQRAVGVARRLGGATQTEQQGQERRRQEEPTAAGAGGAAAPGRRWSTTGGGQQWRHGSVVECVGVLQVLD